MSQRRDSFGSSFDDDRTFTTAWGEYDPRQSNAWSNEGHIPDWAHPYDSPSSSTKNSRYTGGSTRQDSRTSSGIASSWEQWQGVDKPSRILAIVLAVVLGGLGVHRFYLGDKTTGVIMAGITLLSFGSFGWISTLWGFWDAYQFYQMSDAEFDQYCHTKRQVTA